MQAEKLTSILKMLADITRDYYLQKAEEFLNCLNLQLPDASWQFDQPINCGRVQINGDRKDIAFQVFNSHIGDDEWQHQLECWRDRELVYRSDVFRDIIEVTEFVKIIK